MINAALIVETATLMLAAYLGGCLLGYGMRRLLHAAQGKHRPAAITQPSAVRAPAPARTPVYAANNLQQIKGIGPKIEASLQARGIENLEQIAAWSTADIARIDASLAFKGRIARERWVEQAKALTAEQVVA